MIKNKRGSAWIWVIVILILIVVGIAVYFWLSGGDVGSIANAGTSGGNPIPQPPALPSG